MCTRGRARAPLHSLDTRPVHSSKAQHEFPDAESPRPSEGPARKRRNGQGKQPTRRSARHSPGTP
eukprot:13357781-Alexandrium_andersonii.AAC.1